MGEKLWKDPQYYSEGWNFGLGSESIISVNEVAEKFIKFYGSGEIKSISNPNALHEANLLTLDISKSRVRLDWKPVLDIEEALKMTVEWYKNYRKGDGYNFCVSQIEEFIKKGGKT